MLNFVKFFFIYILTKIIFQVTVYVDTDENVNKIAEIIEMGLRDHYDMKSNTRVSKLANRCV